MRVAGKAPEPAPPPETATATRTAHRRPAAGAVVPDRRNSAYDPFPIVLVGGLGKTGGRVRERLAARGIAARPASRGTSPAFDWTERATWGPALAGASAAYVAYQPDLAVPHAADDIAAFADTAASVGVGHIVLLSGRGEDGAVASEARLRAAPVEHTVLRAAWFAENFSEGDFRAGILAGELALPAGSVREPFVSTDDIADAAVAALTDPATAAGPTS